MAVKFDFSGYATKVGLKCSDGRTILKDAFKHMDGKKVPLVWQHLHKEPANILGHSILENRDDGVYAFCIFNDSESAKSAREAVLHGDITALSIYANQLKETAKQVIHGQIREVSLVLTGANPGALIDNLGFAHGEDGYIPDETEAIIYTGLPLNTESLRHFSEADGQKLLGEELNSLTEDQKARLRERLKYQSDDTQIEVLFKIMNLLSENHRNSLYQLMTESVAHGGLEQKDGALAHKKYADDATLQDIFNTLDDTQKTMVYAMVAEAIANQEVEHSEKEGDNAMYHNVFEQAADKPGVSLTHDQMSSIMKAAKEGKTSLKETFLAHAVDYGIEDVEVLFPEARAVRDTPDLVKREDDWVAKFLNAVHKTPFSRIKSHAADLTANDARAKGYITGNRKIEEVFPVLRRVTTPTTIYKKQKLDRDDIVDITDFGVVSWLKSEMRVMLNEEIARAALIGDGRALDDSDSVNPLHIRPVWTDDELYSHKMLLENDITTMDFIDEVVRARKYYKGTGVPNLYTSEEIITDMLLVRDLNGRRLYPTMAELVSALRVKEIIAIEAMEGLTRDITGTSDRHHLMGVLLNPYDYTIGADKGGEVSLFDDFDIDYNQYKYLIETRISGALTKPKSAVVLERHIASGQG